MSDRGYSTVPAKVVIDEALIYDSLEIDFKELVDEDAMQDRKETLKAEKAAVEAARNVNLEELQKLRLSYRDICEIDNLEGLCALSYLSLDNNKIPEIVNIDHLVNLTWLDLSFNKIKEISGLETLIQLKDLTLFNNEITEIKGLSTLTNLHCLSLGNNKISALAEIAKLREYTTLKSLSLEGNPVARMDEYRGFTLAHLESIEFFDYTLVDPEEVGAAQEAFQDELIILQEKESMAKANADRDAIKAAYTANLVQANMGVVETMYSDMFKEDQEMHKLMVLPGIKELLEDYQERINDAAEEFKGKGMEKYKERVQEEENFRESTESARVLAIQDSHKLMRPLLDAKNELVTKLQESEEDEPDISGIDELMGNVDSLVAKLISTEVKRMEAIEKIANLFETRVGDIQKIQLENQNEFFRSVEESEGLFTEALTELAERLSAEMEGDESESLPVEVADLLGDKDSLSTSIQASNDVHIGKLLGAEDALRANEIGYLTSIMAEFKTNKFESNRSRVMEINKFKLDFIKELKELKAEFGN